MTPTTECYFPSAMPTAFQSLQFFSPNNKFSATNNNNNEMLTASKLFAINAEKANEDVEIVDQQEDSPRNCNFSQQPYRKRKYKTRTKIIATNNNNANNNNNNSYGNMILTVTSDNGYSDDDDDIQDDCGSAQRRRSSSSTRLKSLSNSPPIDDERRAHHNELERRRRDHIKDYFTVLKNSIPLLEGEKSSRALILKRAVDYISLLQSQIKEFKEEVEKMKRHNDVLSRAASLLSSPQQQQQNNVLCDNAALKMQVQDYKKKIDELRSHSLKHPTSANNSSVSGQITHHSNEEGGCGRGEIRKIATSDVLTTTKFPGHQCPMQQQQQQLQSSNDSNFSTSPILSAVKNGNNAAAITHSIAASVAHSTFPSMNRNDITQGDPQIRSFAPSSQLFLPLIPHPLNDFRRQPPAANNNSTDMTNGIGVSSSGALAINRPAFSHNARENGAHLPSPSQTTSNLTDVLSLLMLQRQPLISQLSKQRQEQELCSATMPSSMIANMQQQMGIISNFYNSPNNNNNNNTDQNDGNGRAHGNNAKKLDEIISDRGGNQNGNITSYDPNFYDTHTRLFANSLALRERRIAAMTAAAAASISASSASVMH